MKNNPISTKTEKERAFLIGIELDNSNNILSVEDSLEELALLADTAGLEVVGSDIQRLKTPNPATFIGSGKVQEIKAVSESLHADIILFDEELSPRNYRELEEIFTSHIRIIDRTTLILDIFAQHAQTRGRQAPSGISPVRVLSAALNTRLDTPWPDKPAAVVDARAAWAVLV